MTASRADRDQDHERRRCAWSQNCDRPTRMRALAMNAEEQRAERGARRPCPSRRRCSRRRRRPRRRPAGSRPSPTVRVDRPELDHPHDARRPGRAGRRSRTRRRRPAATGCRGSRPPPGCCRPRRPARPKRRHAQDHGEPDGDRRRRRATKTGIPRTVARASAVKPAGRPARGHLVAAGDQEVDAADRCSACPSVATIDGTRKTVTMTPLTIPRTSPSPTPNSDRARDRHRARVLEDVRRRRRRRGRSSPRPRGRRSG